MHDPIAAGRRAALRATGAAAVVVGVVAAAFGLAGLPSALSAAWGGTVMVAALGLTAVVALGGIVPARVAFSRLLLATVGKWCVALAGVAAGLAAWRLPPLPMLAGLVAGLLAYQLALHLQAVSGSRQQTGSVNRTQGRQ